VQIKNNFSLSLQRLFCVLTILFVTTSYSSVESLDSLKRLDDKEVVSSNDALWSKPSSDILESQIWEGSDWNLAELLEMQSDFSIKRLGPKGSYSLFSRSGIPGSSIRILIDGIPQNPPGGGNTNLELLSLNDIESVELNRSSDSKNNSGGWPGGTIQLKSKKFAPSVRGEFLVGSYEHFEGSFSYKEDWRILKTSISGQYLTSENNYQIFSNNNTPYNVDDDFWLELDNAAQKNWLINTKIFVKDWFFKSQFQKIEMGIPGFEGARNPNAKFHSQRIETTLGNSNKNFPYKISYQNSGDFYSWGTQDKFWRAVQKDSEVGQLSQRIYSTGQLKYFSFFSIPVEGSWEYIAPRTNNDRFKVGLNWTAERYSFDPSLNSYTSWKALDFEFKYHLNYRIESAKNSKDTLTTLNQDQSWHSAYGGKTYFSTSPNTQFWLGFERTHLAPSLVQKFGGGQGALGNHQLKDETGWLVETGRSYKSKITPKTFSYFRIKPFWQLRNDAIQYFIATDLSKAFNTGRMETWAIKFSENIKNPYFGFFNTFLFQSTLWTTGPSQLIDNTPPGTPNWTISSRIHLQPFNKSFKTLHPFKMVSTYKIQGASFKDKANLEQIDPYQLLNFRLIYSPQNWKISFGVNNIFDNIIENSYSTFPLEGRSFYSKISFDIITQQTPQEKI
jgi:outer membrane cobalamin receptor